MDVRARRIQLFTIGVALAATSAFCSGKGQSPNQSGPMGTGAATGSGASSGSAGGTGGAGGGAAGSGTATTGSGGTAVGGSGGGQPVPGAGGSGGGPTRDGANQSTTDGREPAASDAPRPLAEAGVPVSGDAGGANALTIFWSDTEGGAATIIVTPGGQVLVADAGWPGARDPDRIVKILTQIGAKKIDYMIVTHYHTDHVGGVIDLAGKIPITTFVDHGPSVEAGADAAYATLAAGKRMTVKPGDTLPLTGVELTFVISHAEPLSRPLPGAGAPNPLCANAVMRAKVPSDENSRSVGFVLRQGKFGFLDLGDLLWGNEHELACPTNNLGQIDLFQVTHHGFAISNAPQLVHAIEPVVAVSNNGASKGGAAATFDVLMRAPMPMDVWQLHRSGSASAAQNAPADRIANDGAPDQGFWIKAVVEPSGRFTVTNGRNGFSKTYESR